jgi:hypothetical protein
VGLHARIDSAAAAPARGEPEAGCFILGDLTRVSAGEGIYSAVFNAWGAGEHGVLPVTREVEIGQACELPAFNDARLLRV